MQKPEAEQIQKKKKRKIIWFIGVDISKYTLDYAVLFKGELLFRDRRENNIEAIKQFLAELKGVPKFSMAAAVFCFEAMGTYGNHLSGIVTKSKGKAVAVNPLIIKNFLGLTRGKDDRADALRIAQYAYKNADDLIFRLPERPVLTELKMLFAIRERMLATCTALKTPLGELKGFISPVLIKRCLIHSSNSIQALESDLERIEIAIDTILKDDVELNRLATIIRSVPGIGKVTALLILITTNEFKDIYNSKKFACYAGIAPFRNESGLIIRKARVSHFANKKMKSLLHMCALSALRFDAQLIAYFKRKTVEEGKAKLLVINAVRYKLVRRVFSCVRQNRIFEKTNDIPV